MVEASGPSGGAKGELRREVLGKRDAVGEDERVASSRSIVRKVISLAAYRRAAVVMAYAGIGSEIQTGPFLRSVLRDGKTLVLPRVDRAAKFLALHEVTDLARDLEAGVWGILEPRPDPGSAVELGAVDFALVPGVAFDARGGRLGHGAGFYDKLLGSSDERPLLVAGAFEVQMVDELPVEGHDVFMDLVATERNWYPSRPRAEGRAGDPGGG